MPSPMLSCFDHPYCAGWILAIEALVAFWMQDGLQRDNPVSMLTPIIRAVRTVNEWIAEKFGTTTTRILQIEIGTFLALGLAMLSIEEYAAAVACFVLVAVVWIAKALDGIIERQPIIVFIQIVHAVFALIICVLLITITDVRKDDKSWSNLIRGKPETITNDNIEKYVSTWLRNVKLSPRKLKSPGALFSLDVTIKGDHTFNVKQLRDRENYLIISAT